MPMPYLGSYRSPLFKGLSVLEFFRRYKQDYKDYYVLADDRHKRLPNYYIPSVVRTMRSMKQWINADYKGLKKAMLKNYVKDDIE